MTKAYKLSAKQKLFAEYCAKGKTQIEAYRLAGYKTDNMTPETLSRAASRCMANVHVKAYYDSLLEKAQEKAVEAVSYDKEDWMRTQMEILSISMGKQEVSKVITNEDGEKKTTIKAVDLSSALKAQEQLGKSLALFIDKKELDGSMTVTNLIQELSKEAGESEDDSPLPKDNM